MTQSILDRDPERFHRLAIRSYRWPNSEVRYRTAPNFCSTSSSLALRRARFHFDRENRCQSPSRCCRILADCRCCSCKRDRRGTRSALSLSGPSSAQPVGTFGAAVPGNRPLEVGNQTDRQRPQVKTAFMQINSGLPSEQSPDGNREGIPNSLLEARATGLPCITTAHGEFLKRLRI